MKLTSIRLLAFCLPLFGIVAFLSTGCDRKASLEKALRQRHAEFIQAIYRENYDECVKFADPSFVQAKGTEATKGMFKIIGAFVKLAKLTPEDVRIDSITFDDKLTSAQIQTSHRIKGEWKAQKPSVWIYINGQWYIKI